MLAISVSRKALSSSVVSVGQDEVGDETGFIKRVSAHSPDKLAVQRLGTTTVHLPCYLVTLTLSSKGANSKSSCGLSVPRLRRRCTNIGGAGQIGFQQIQMQHVYKPRQQQAVPAPGCS